MNTFVDDIKNSFISRYGAVAQIITINIAIYLIIGIIALIMALSGFFGAFSSLFGSWLSLSSNLSSLIFKPWTIITYGFLHWPNDVLHILFNMLTFYWFGRILFENISNRNAHVWTLYILGVLSGAILFLITMNLLPAFSRSIPRGGYFLNGASAGVMAIVVAAATYLPNFTFHLFLIGPVRIKWIALVLVLLDIILIPSDNPGGRIAHIGGALIGFIYIRQLKRGNDWSALYVKLTSIFERKKHTKATNMKIVVDRRGSENFAGGITQQEIDRILEKIHAVGYENLTLEEKQTLFKAGKDN